MLIQPREALTEIRRLAQQSDDPKAVLRVIGRLAGDSLDRLPRRLTRQDVAEMAHCSLATVNRALRRKELRRVNGSRHCWIEYDEASRWAGERDE
jgi:CRP-like cAMP-binding protein